MKFTDVLERERVEKMLISFQEIAGIPAAILDLEGNTIVSAGWRSFCLAFHNKNPLSVERCQMNRHRIQENLVPGEFVESKCANGLWDAATPIVVNEEVLGVLYLGQYLYDEEGKDLEFFFDQADALGFQRKDYMDEVRRVPVLPKKRIESIKQVYFSFVQSLVEMGASRLEAERSMQRLENAMNALPTPVFFKDSYGAYQGVNTAFSKMLGIPRNEIVGKRIDNKLSRNISDLMNKQDIELLENSMARQYQSKFVYPDGRKRQLSFKKSSYLSIDNTTEIVGIVEDLTEQILYSQKLKQMINEKDLLLYEVHHRVKNNLQIIISLLSLEMKAKKENECSPILSNTLRRIRVMSIVHDRMYRTDTIEYIDIGDFISILIRDLYPFAGKVRIVHQLERGAHFTSIESAIPLGLLVNEIITNSLEHAFPNNAKGEIQVLLERLDDSVFLRIGDNGAGLPENFAEIQKHSLGMKMIEGLVRQIDGTLSIQS
ncbi:MAG: PocR ligand-binding domain-containing protein, partial [Spirochaetia bacterium]